MKKKLVLLTISLTALTGCTTTSNVNVRTANVSNNTAVVVNNNTATNIATNMNRWNNSNISREEYDKTRAEYEKEKGSSTIGQGINDSWLWFKTRAALLAADDLRDSTINVDVVNDVVTLKGTIANPGQKRRAEEVAKGIDGVKSVKNELQVSRTDSVTNQIVNGNTKPAANANANKK